VLDLQIEDVRKRLNIDVQVTEGTPPAPTAVESFGDMVSPFFCIRSEEARVRSLLSGPGLVQLT
jgi:hypothetical protein